MSNLFNDFIKFPVNSLSPDLINFSIFLYLPLNKRFLKVSSPGIIYNKKRQDDLKARGIEHIYIPVQEAEHVMKFLSQREAPQAEENSLVSELKQILEQGFKNIETPKVPQEDRMVKLYNALDSNLIKDLVDSQVPEDELVESLSSLGEEFFRNLVRVASEELISVDSGFEGCKRLALEILDTIQDQGDIYKTAHALILKGSAIRDHSVAVASFAVTMGMLFGVSEKQDLGILSLAGLFHDYGLIEAPISLVKKVENLRSPDEQSLYLKHVYNGPKKLVELYPDFPGLAIRAINEIHENFDGTGLPQGVKGDQIHDMSHILTIANTFDKLIKGRLDGSPKKPHEAIDIIVNAQDMNGLKLQKFNPYYISVLTTMLKS